MQECNYLWIVYCYLLFGSDNLTDENNLTVQFRNVQKYTSY